MMLDQCEKCGRRYANNWCKWCKLCQTSGNRKIDDVIQEMQSNSNDASGIFEWIPYNQFNNVEEIDKGGFVTVYPAIWKDGLLCYNEKKLMRKSGEKFAIKCLYNL